MEKKPVRVLQVNGGSKNFGGVSAMLFEIYRHIDRKKVQFDFVSPNKTTYELKRNEIEEMGGSIYELNISGNFIKRKILLFFRLKKLIKNNKYTIVHINSGALFFNLEIAIISKLLGVKKIIIHSHNGLNPNKKIKNFFIFLFKPAIKFFGTDFFTCSELAAESMFTSKMIKSGKVKMIPNGIDTDNFLFNHDIRTKYRKDMGIENKLVVGNIGRFCEQKNHRFLIDIFKEILKIEFNAVLMLVGEGELLDNIKLYVKELKIEDKVLFLGLRKDISNLLMAMDVFVMSSFFEGLPVTGIEAQASGLPIVFSDYITKQVDLTGNVKFLNLNDSAQDWAKSIFQESKMNNSRIESCKMIREKGFDINDVSKEILEIYLN